MNLNTSIINTDGNIPPQPFADFHCVDPTASVSVYFRDIEHHLIRHIRAATHVVGCVAWLTHEQILHELAQKELACIAVQKEDFLRPDLSTNNQWKQRLRFLYSQLKAPEIRYEFIAPLCDMSSHSLWEGESVRCVGNHNRAKNSAFPRSHHKFLVFLEPVPRITVNGYDGGYRATAVWTGSFNFTKNAGNSLENALYIESPKIAESYYREWSQVMAISEPLDWECDWIAPEWRIGT